MERGLVWLSHCLREKFLKSWTVCARFGRRHRLCVIYSTHTAELKKDIDHEEAAALPISCQICKEAVFLESFFLRLRYVFVSVVCIMQVEQMRKLIGTCCHKGFSWYNKYAIVKDKYAIVLRHGVERGCTKNMHRKRKYHVKKNIV